MILPQKWQLRISTERRNQFNWAAFLFWDNTVVVELLVTHTKPCTKADYKSSLGQFPLRNAAALRLSTKACTNDNSVRFGRGETRKSSSILRDMISAKNHFAGIMKS